MGCVECEDGCVECGPNALALCASNHPRPKKGSKRRHGHINPGEWTKIRTWRGVTIYAKKVAAGEEPVLWFKATPKAAATKVKKVAKKKVAARKGAKSRAQQKGRARKVGR